MSINILEWMQEWLASNCDGDWEHAENFTITTIDNPGWSIKINLLGTDLEEKPFTSVSFDKSEEDWVRCKVKDSQFQGYGGARNLTEMLEIFIRWAES